MIVDVDLERVQELASRGLTLEQIAVALGISPRTLYNRRRKFAEVADAIKKGRALGVAAVASKLWEAAMAGNITAIIFYLKTRGGWSEKAQIDVSIDSGRRIPDGIGGWYSVADAEIAKRLTTDELMRIASLH